MLVSDLSYSDFFGRQAIGKVMNGRAHFKDGLVCIGEGDRRERPLNVSKLHTYSASSSWRPRAPSRATSSSSPA
jgi:GTP-binding protein